MHGKDGHTTDDAVHATFMNAVEQWEDERRADDNEAGDVHNQHMSQAIAESTVYNIACRFARCLICDVRPAAIS
eukprot:13523186-Alexandrium_andersonii.AAC.1